METQGRAWEQVHKVLSESMNERLVPYRKSITNPDHMRGSFDDCRFKANVVSCESIDNDIDRRTAKVTLDISKTGLTFGPGDRIALMPLNSTSEVNKVVQALDLTGAVHKSAPLPPSWERFAQHIASVYRDESARILTIQDIISRGRLAPLAQSTVYQVFIPFKLSNKGSSSSWRSVADCF